MVCRAGFLAAAYLDVAASPVIAGAAAAVDNFVAAVDFDDTVAAVAHAQVYDAVAVADDAVAYAQVDDAVAAADDAVAAADDAVAQIDDAVAAADNTVAAADNAVAVADTAYVDDAVHNADTPAIVPAAVVAAVAAYHKGDDVADDLEIAAECDHSHFRRKNSNLRVKLIHHPWQREVWNYLRQMVRLKVIRLPN